MWFENSDLEQIFSLEDPEEIKIFKKYLRNKTSELKERLIREINEVLSYKKFLDVIPRNLYIIVHSEPQLNENEIENVKKLLGCEDFDQNENEVIFWN
ncbi:MAG: hypothetical protein FWH29_04280 [Methanobrevibacter sp.]|nr:hypothetical protein [Methanobrevibacter sp.]